MGIDGWDVRIWMAGNRVCNKKDTHASTQSTRGTDFSPDSTPKICRSETSFFTLGGVILCSAMTSLPSSRLGSCWFLGTHSFFLLRIISLGQLYHCLAADQPPQATKLIPAIHTVPGQLLHHGGIRNGTFASSINR